MADEEMETWDDSGAEGRSGLYIGEGESYRYLRIFYDPRTKTFTDDQGKKQKIEVANFRTIGVINNKQHEALFGMEAVAQLYRQMGMYHLANSIDHNHESFFTSTVSINGTGRQDNRVILGRSVSAPKKKGLFGLGKKE